ncbi:DUF4279 domain-containing protein [Verminephrobacter eiseniae]|uniref:DUF4279 domain-containing protein n=1 Tax=Verminephrobacter eiseniae TaxID=364317 RepID=UPI002237B447|nr:DUF4279 domain-containing protein [Verminephrobacter eiseniae]MCW5236610.1 DUF4279 domain-containing protein [Verminephrobacter eiseniae]
MQLEPSEISARLNLESNNSFSKSQNQPTERQRTPFWGYDGKGDAGYQHDWESLEDGLKFLIKILDSRKAEIIAIGRQFDGCWWCGYSQANSDGGGPMPSPPLLAEIGSYEMPLCIENYFVIRD